MSNLTYDKIAGVLFGGAIGDALGLPAERKTEQWCKDRYPEGGPFAYERVERPVLGEVFEAGDWSDDTDQALILVDSWLEHHKLVPTDIAARLLVWARTQKGMGGHTRKVLEHEAFATDPYRASEAIWFLAPSDRYAPNGAIMRSAVCGLMGQTPFETAQIAAGMAKVTHFDPRCTLSAAIVAVAVHHLTRGMTSISDAVDQGYEEAESLTVAEDWRMPIHEAYDDECNNNGAPLDNTDQGFTFTTLRAAVSHAEVLDRMMPRPEETSMVVGLSLAALIRKGGDADTNAAVCGALMGARVGLGGLPLSLTSTLRQPYELERRALALERLHK